MHTKTTKLRIKQMPEEWKESFILPIFMQGDNEKTIEAYHCSHYVRWSCQT